MIIIILIIIGKLKSFIKYLGGCITRQEVPSYKLYNYVITHCHFSRALLITRTKRCYLSSFVLVKSPDCVFVS